MTKIYNCSNSTHRPAHRDNSGCPKENDIVCGLIKYAHRYNCEFVDDVDDSDVIFTNDIYPPNLIGSHKPKVKRMDGIYFTDEFVGRNTPLNEAARQSDHVIFISEFSKQSYYQLYAYPLRDHSVVLNWVDNNIFNVHEYNLPEPPYTWVACCSDWSRSEKRYDLLERAIFHICGSSLDNLDKIQIIGKVPEDKKLIYPVEHLGYISSDEERANIFRNATFFINTSFRDAAPKVVAQAISCGLIVLAGLSGGVSELGKNGVIYPLEDETDYSIHFSDKIPIDLKTKKLKDTIELMKRDLKCGHAHSLSTNDHWETMLDGYFKVLKSFS